jgi:hypothetical protein
LSTVDAAAEELNHWLEQKPGESHPDEDDQNEDSDERVRIVRRALEMIRPDFQPSTRDAFWKVVVDEMEPAEVVAMVGISRNPVYLARSHLLSRLRELFDRLVEEIGALDCLARFRRDFDRLLEELTRSAEFHRGLARCKQREPSYQPR